MARSRAEVPQVLLHPGDRIVTPQLDAFQDNGNRVVDNLLDSCLITYGGALGQYPRTPLLRTIRDMKNALRVIRTQAQLDFFEFQVDTGTIGDEAGKFFQHHLVTKDGRIKEIELDDAHFRRITIYETALPDILMRVKTRLHTPNADRSLVGRHTLFPLFHAEDFPKHFRLPSKRQP